MKARLPPQLLERLLDPFFASRLREAIRSRLVPLAKRDPRLVEFVSRETGIPEETLKAHWDEVYRVILAVYRGRVKTRSAGSVARYVTPATAVFWAAYEEMGPAAAARVYEALEPLVLGDPGRARLLFLPVTRENLRAAVELAVEAAARLGLGERGLNTLASTLCAVTGHLDAKTAGECVNMVRRLWSTLTSGSRRQARMAIS